MVLRSESLHVEPHFHFACDRRKTRLVVTRLKSELAFDVARSSRIVGRDSDVETNYRSTFINRDHTFGKLQLPHQRAWIRNWSNPHAGRRFKVQLCGNQKLVERLA